MVAQTGRGGVPRQRKSSDVLLQMWIPPYREGFLDEVFSRQPDLRVVAGDQNFTRTARVTPYAAAHTERVRNHFHLGNRVAWQSGAWRACRAAPGLVLELNPRILSNWTLLLYRRATNRHTILWGHARPRQGAGSRTTFLRRWMLRLADGALAYTEDDRRHLASLGTPAHLAANAVDRRDATTPALGQARHVLQIGRLLKEKKPQLALEAFAAAVHRLPVETKLVFVGAGPLESELSVLAERLGISARVEFRGPIYDAAALRDVFADTLVSLSPGYAGLTVTQSLAHGVPMLVADDEPHAPEVSLCDDSNSRWFRSGDPGALAETLVEAFVDRGRWLARRRDISAGILAKYSIEAMAEGFLSSLAARE